MDVQTLDLTFGDLRGRNVARCLRWHPGGIESWSRADWMQAALGELGEAANISKKLKRDEDGLVGNSDEDAALLRGRLADELADTVIYLDLLAAREGIDLAEAIRAKFNRTSAKNGFPERL